MLKTFTAWFLEALDSTTDNPRICHGLKDGKPIFEEGRSLARQFPSYESANKYAVRCKIDQLVKIKHLSWDAPAL